MEGAVQIEDRPAKLTEPSLSADDTPQIVSSTSTLECPKILEFIESWVQSKTASELEQVTGRAAKQAVLDHFQVESLDDEISSFVKSNTASIIERKLDQIEAAAKQKKSTKKTKEMESKVEEPEQSEPEQDGRRPRRAAAAKILDRAERIKRKRDSTKDAPSAKRQKQFSTRGFRECSAEIAELMGSEHAVAKRGDVVKRLISYIKDKDLLQPNNRRFINTTGDDLLNRLFKGKKNMTFFSAFINELATVISHLFSDMQRELNAHFFDEVRDVPEPVIAASKQLFEASAAAKGAEEAEDSC